MIKVRLLIIFSMSSVSLEIFNDKTLLLISRIENADLKITIHGFRILNFYILSAKKKTEATVWSNVDFIIIESAVIIILIF